MFAIIFAIDWAKMMEYMQMMLKKVAISILICVAIVISFHNRLSNGFTRLQASTDFACMGENVTFSCTTLNSVLIWEVTFTDWTIRPVSHLFQISDTPGRLLSESTRGMHLYFQIISNNNGILDSVLVLHTSASLENAGIECEGSETRRLIFRLAYAPNTPTGVLISEKVYNSSEFASATLSWNDPIGRVDNYNIRISVGSSFSQQYGVAIPSLKLDQIPYNENVTVGISAVNCIAESEEVNISFVISACNSSLSLPLGGLVYNTSSSFNGIVPSGEQIWFGCEAGFYPIEPVVSTCQEDSLWHPDPSKLVCRKECLVPANLTNLELNFNDDSSTSLRIFFRCKDGFVPKDEQTAVCSSNGTWFPDLTQFECHRRMAPTLTNTNSSSCTSCLVYIITGSVVGIIILVVVCTLLFSVMVYIILHSKKSDTSSRDHSTPELPDPVYEYITSPVYEYLNPIVTSVMTENEAYNTCCEEIKAYDIV